jgi:hypothetical protein
LDRAGRRHDSPVRTGQDQGAVEGGVGGRNRGEVLGISHETYRGCYNHWVLGYCLARTG